MKYVLNYSHPLGTLAKSQLAEMVGEYTELIIPCQIDLDKPISAQLHALIDAGHKALWDAGLRNSETMYQSWPDLLIPPALSFAAAVVGGYMLQEADSSMYRQGANMIVLMRNNQTPPQFEIAAIV